MAKLLRKAGPLVMLAILSGCTSDHGQTMRVSSAQIFGQVKQFFGGKRGTPPAKVHLTAEQRANFDKPVLQVNPEILGGSDFLGLTEARSDAGLGEIRVWNSTDNARLYLRNGVVVGTRGLGGDIISADATMTIKALGGGSRYTGSRSYVVSDGDVTTTTYEFSCTVEQVGSEDINIASHLFRTTKFVENCVGGPAGEFAVRNDYWVQEPGNFVRKSRQWMGPRIGYFEILLIKR